MKKQTAKPNVRVIRFLPKPAKPAKPQGYFCAICYSFVKGCPCWNGLNSSCAARQA